MATSEQQQARGVMEQIEKLSLEQIRQVKEQVDSEVSLLQDSIANIRTAASRFEAASKAVNNLSLHPPGMPSRYLCFDNPHVCTIQLTSTQATSPLACMCKHTQARVHTHLFVTE